MLCWQILLGGVLTMASVSLPQQDSRLTQIRHLNLRYELPKYSSIGEWTKRAEELRLHVKISLGLFPMLPKTPLNPRRIVCYEDEDVIVERVAFESMPGFFVTGNLYRPKSGKPPYPAVLHPHGHVPQPEGRLYKREMIRAMAMAKLGFVVFAYDMVGYGDQFQVVHRGEETPQEHLWAISRGGVQAWNSTRVIDFLQSLPEVDGKRIGCCGSSGGGTQTFFLAAVDERLAVAIPTKMVSAHMQGGCVCENPPILRIDTSNPEIVALFAPRPLMLISDDGDWTKETPKYEFPFVKSIYKLYGAEERCKNAHFSEGHDFAQASREAYYNWAIQWLKNEGKQPKEAVKEPEISLPAQDAFRVWGSDLPKPKNAVSWDEVVKWIKERANEAIEQMCPKDKKSLEKFQKEMLRAMRRVFVAQIPSKSEIVVHECENTVKSGVTLKKFWLGRVGVGDKIPAVLLASGKRKSAVLVVSEKGAASEVLEGSGEVSEILFKMVNKFDVLAIDTFLTGMAFGKRERNVQFFTTYNRTDDAERVQDVITSLSFLKSRYANVNLVGIGNAGLWALFAQALTGFATKTAIDLAQFNPNDDEDFVRRFYVPCLRRIGDFRTALMLISPRPLLLHNIHENFPKHWAEMAYKVANARTKLHMANERISFDELTNWLSSSK
jgi:dienelactone hydrolase